MNASTAAEVQPPVPIEYSELKECVRKGLSNHESRIAWWPAFINLPPGRMIDTMPDVTGTASRLQTILKEPLLTSDAQPESDSVNKEHEYIASTIQQLMYIMNKGRMLDSKDQHTCYRWDVLLRILIYVFRRIDLCYMVFSDLLSNQEKYLQNSFEGHANMLNTFKEMLNNFMPKTYEALSSMGALDDRYLDLMFVGFFTELLPPHVVLRLVGSFLLEGRKILFRYALALMRGYKSLIKGGKYATASEFWLSVKADAIASINKGIATAGGTSMLFKQLGLEGGLPAVDPFVVYSKAKNKEFMSSDKMLTYSFDVGRSGFEKLRRPMSVSSQTIRRGSANTKRDSVSGAAMSSSSSLPDANREAATSASAAAIKSNSSSTSSNSTSPGDDRAAAAATLKRAGSVTAMAVTDNRTTAGASSLLQRRGSTNKRPPTGHAGGSGAAAGGVASGSGIRIDNSTSLDSRGLDSPMSAGRSEVEDNFTGQSSPFLPHSFSDSDPPTPAASGKEAVPLAVATEFGGCAEQDSAHAADTAGALNHLRAASTILDSSADLTRTLLAFLPLDPYDIVTGKGLKLVFSTETHGYNLSALYTRLTGHANIVLLVRLAGDYRNVVLGAYISTELTVNKGSQTKKCGNATTRCFRLDAPNAVLYTSAIGNKVSAVTPRKPAADSDTENAAAAVPVENTTGISEEASNEVIADAAAVSDDTVAESVAPTGVTATASIPPLALEAADNGAAAAVDEGAKLAAMEQYVVAAKEYLSLGCSLQHGTAALRIDEDLSILATGVTDTFNNPPLVSADNNSFSTSFKNVIIVEGHASTFPIETVEVLAAPSNHRRR